MGTKKRGGSHAESRSRSRSRSRNRESPNPLSNLFFRTLNDSNHAFIINKLKEFDIAKKPDSTPLYACEWCSAFPDSDTTLYLYDDVSLYGAVDYGYTARTGDDTIFVYSIISCTFERLVIPGHPECSSGRVLRAFHLDHHSKRFKGCNIVLWGNVISDAYGYNIAMGLQLYPDLYKEHYRILPPQNTPNLLRYISVTQNNEEKDAGKIKPMRITSQELNKNPSEKGNNYLFFFLPKNRHRYGAYRIIQEVLPRSTKL
jgi:hypothetical protein